MRIIAGEYGGRKLNTPTGRDTRPTSDRLRESIFSQLTHHFAGSLSDIRVADIFAGTGAMGLEAISRGAQSAIFVEKHQGLELIKENAELLGCEDKCQFLGADARNLPSISEPLDLIFLDPPYGRELAEPALSSALKMNWLKTGAIALVELGADDTFNCPDGFLEIKQKISGKTKLITLQVL